MIINENIRDALNTDGEIPVIKTNRNRHNIMTNVFMNLKRLALSIRENKNTRMLYITPVCNPETDNMCKVPE